MRIEKAFADLVAAIAPKHGLDVDLIEAVILTESSGQFHAYRFEPAFWDRYLKNHPDYRHMLPRTAAASYGLMQLMYPTARQEGFTGKPWELFDPSINIEYGCRHLARHLAWADSHDENNVGIFTLTELRSALAAYNGDRQGNEPDANPDRNAVYADKVLNNRRLVITAKAQAARDAAVR